jgi:hypothetical protein
MADRQGLIPGLSEVTSIFPEQIEEEFVRTPADVAYWNAQFSDALDEYLRARARRDLEWSRIWLLTRERLLAAGEKATEKIVDAMTTVDAEYQAANEASIAAEAKKARLYGAVDAVRAKKDMIQSLGAKLRAELEGDPMVRHRERAAHGRDIG